MDTNGIAHDTPAPPPGASSTDPTFPTRLDTSTAPNTTPDLTFTKNEVNAQWRNIQYDIRSDRSITEITLPHLTTLSTRTRKFAAGLRRLPQTSHSRSDRHPNHQYRILVT